MRIRHLALWTALASSLVAQGTDPGFGWLGVRAGNLVLDPQDHAKAGTFVGGQVGLVLDQQQYGLSLEGLSAHPTSDLFPDLKVNHSAFSATFLTGLTGGSLGGFWPYFGLGLGSISVAQTTRATRVIETGRAVALHASLGILHRPGLHLLWGVEGRYLAAFSNKDRKDLQLSAQLGFTWGGSSGRANAAPEPPPMAVKEAPQSTPPAPLPPQLPLQPAPEAALPVVAVSVVKPAPQPAVTPEPETVLPPPPSPPPVLAPAPPPAAAPTTMTPMLVVAPLAAPSSLSDRLEALRKGDMSRSIELGRARIAAIPKGHWTIRLEIANLSSTLGNAVRAFSEGRPDLFVAPIQLRGGKTAYQLFLGDYASREEAERAAKSVPGFFLEGGQRPKPFLGAGIPTQGNQAK